MCIIFIAVCQFDVLAQDLGGIHALNSSNVAKVTVTVKRNTNGPSFQGLPYQRTIAQTQEELRTFFTVRAIDEDDRVSGQCFVTECVRVASSCQIHKNDVGFWCYQLVLRYHNKQIDCVHMNMHLTMKRQYRV